MNEKVTDFFKVSRFWLIVGAVLLAWGIGGTIAGVYFHGKYKSLRSIIDNAGGDELVSLIQQHGDGLVSHLENLNTIQGELESANGRAAELEQRNKRAYEFALLTDGELANLGSAMANNENILLESISIQRRTIEAFGRIQRYNRFIKAELGDSD